MRSTQNISTRGTYRLSPAQRRLSAAVTGPGMKVGARRSAMPRARRAEVVAAVTGSLVILSLLAGLSVL